MPAAVDLLSIFGDLFNTAQLIPLAIVLVIVTYLMMAARRKHQQRYLDQNEDRPLQRDPPSAEAGSKQQLRRDLESLLAELQDLSRKISAQIDTRFAKLEAAIRDADRRIATLNRLSRSGGKTDTPDATSTGAMPVVNGHEVVYELADAGKTAVEIARELGKTPGEVELILNLRGKAGSP